MKRIFFALITIAAMLAACSPEGLTQAPSVSFVAAKPDINARTAVFRIVTRGNASTDAITVPVTFDGTAQKGIDYLASSEAFIIGGEAPVDSIVVTTLQLGTDKTVSLSLDLPSGFSAGWHRTAEFTLQDKFGYLGFRNARSMAGDTLNIDITVTGRDGAAYAAAGSGLMSLIVDKDQSTAVEGTHFAFVDSQDLQLTPGTSQARIRIVVLQDLVSSDRDRLVLGLRHSDDFGQGQTLETDITLLGRSWAALDGDWQIDSLVTDSLYMESIWKETCSVLDSLPEFHASDAITFSLASATASPSFRSSFKDYFIGSSELTKGEMMELDLGNGETAAVQTFAFSNTNRYFSPDEQSEDKESLVGFRMKADEETGDDVLDMFVIDHTSRTFMPELDSLGLYAAEKPVAAAPGFFLNAVFRRQ